MPLTFHGAFLEILTQKPQILHGYLIRLTREYTDGGMDSRADEYEFHYSRIFYKWDIDSIKKISYSFSFIQTSDCCARIILAAVTFREWTERVGP